MKGSVFVADPNAVRNASKLFIVLGWSLVVQSETLLRSIGNGGSVLYRFCLCPL